MSKKKQLDETISPLVTSRTSTIDEMQLFKRVSEIIENRQTRAGVYANREVTLMYWEVGQYINSVVLDYKRAEYGRKILATLSRQLSWSPLYA